MTSVGIAASIYMARSSQMRFHKKQSQLSLSSQASSLETGEDAHVVIPFNLEGHDHLNLMKKGQHQKPNYAKEEKQLQVADSKHTGPRFFDERWKSGTWDLNMFVKRGKMNWDAVIVAGLQILGHARGLYKRPEKQEEEDFLNYILKQQRTRNRYSSEAQLYHGGLGSHILTFPRLSCSTAKLQWWDSSWRILATVVGVALFRNGQDFKNMQKLADEITFYDRQWEASWQNQDSNKEI